MVGGGGACGAGQAARSREVEVIADLRMLAIACGVVYAAVIEYLATVAASA